jgi:hypothetical protein
MALSTNNPAVEAIRQNVRSSYEELNRLLDGPLAALDPAILYRSPAPDEWTIMQNIAHIIEFMPYWADEAAKLVATPGMNFGRTHQHEGRLGALREHGEDSLEQARALLPGSYAHLDHVLSSLKDSDLTVVGHHLKYGDRQLSWFLDEFVTRHLADHVKQMKEALQAIEAE